MRYILHGNLRLSVVVSGVGALGGGGGVGLAAAVTRALVVAKPVQARDGRHA